MSTEAKARLEIKKLLAEVNQLQTHITNENVAKKAEIETQLSKVNELRVAALQEKSPEKMRLVKQETRKLYQEQLGYIESKRKSARNQATRLEQALGYLDVIAQAKGEQSPQDSKLQQKLTGLLKRRQAECTQFERDAKALKERASQSSVSSSKSTQNNAELGPSGQPGKSIEEQREQARQEAEQILHEQVQKAAEQQAESGTKTREISKLMSEISALQDAANKGLLTEEEAVELEDRVKQLESRQRQSRDQINQLTQAKIKYELAMAKANEQKEQEEKRRVRDHQIQQQLNEMIKIKENEQQDLISELEKIRIRSEHEAQLLKAQRDAARALAEKEFDDAESGVESPKPPNRYVMAALITIILLVLLGVGLYFSPFWPQVASLLGGEEVPAIDKPEVTPETAPAPPKPESSKPSTRSDKPSQTKNLPTVQDSLTGGGKGPIMVRLPGGSFKLGAAPHMPELNEKPQIEVTLNRFAISKYEITFAEYERYAKEENVKLPDDKGWGRGQHPVINVTWWDAQKYTEWLSRKTGQKYRLPSEREWEYAARAGEDADNYTLYGWGDKLGVEQANCGPCNTNWSAKSTAPVGKFPANAFGLHDMIGNVMEWTISCYRNNYGGAPKTGNLWQEPGNCSRRTARNGHFSSYSDLHITKRSGYNPNVRARTLGFRVVRQETP